jgi:hypothetical protein
MGWNLACPDWQTRIQSRTRSLLPELPLLDQAAAKRAVTIFDKLRLPDVPGQPTMGESAGDWFRDIVRALFGSMDKETSQRMIREIFLLVPKKNSKALDLDTEIATPTGFTTMRNIRIGDDVFDSDGKITKVTEKSPVFIGRDCYEVVFSTGESVVCDAEHLWVTDTHIDRGNRVGDRRTPCPSIKTTAEIARTLKVKSGRYEINNHRTSLCGSLDLPEARLPIQPYVLGLWLGDGHSEQAVITAGAAEADHIIQQIASTGHSVRLKAYFKPGGAARLSIAEPGNKNAHLPYRFRTEAIKLGLFGNKHIPQQYLRASRDQRLDLLRGLMDSDGTISKAGQASYSTTLEALRDGVIELINSLGFKASVSESRSTLYGVDHGPAWSIQFWPFDNVAVFTLPRKLARQRPTKARNSPRSTTRQIVEVKRVPSRPVQCIAVESDSHQYLVTRSLIPTHNTTNGAALMVTALLLNKRPNAEFLLIAPTQPITRIAFDQAAGMIEADPRLRDPKLTHIQYHNNTITYLPTGATLQVKSFDPKIVTGVKPAGVLVDELHVVSETASADRVIGQLRGGIISQSRIGQGSRHSRRQARRSDAPDTL